MVDGSRANFYVVTTFCAAPKSYRFTKSRARFGSAEEVCTTFSEDWSFFLRENFADSEDTDPRRSHAGFWTLM
jgi:hypothetical protein